VIATLGLISTERVEGLILLNGKNGKQKLVIKLTTKIDNIIKCNIMN